MEALRPYRARLVLLGALTLGATASEGAGIGLFYPLVEYIQKGADFGREGAAKRIFDFLAAAGLVPGPGLLVSGIACVLLMALAFKRGVFLVSASIYAPLMRDLRVRALTSLLEAHAFHFYRTPSAATVHALEDEVEHLGQALNFLVTLAATALASAVLVVLMLALSWRLTMLVAVIAAARYMVAGAFMRRLRELGREFSDLRVREKSLLGAIHQGIDTVKAYATEGWETARFSALADGIRVNALAVARAQSGATFYEGLIGDGLLCAVVYLAVARFGLSGAVLLTFLFVVSRLVPKISQINDARVRVAEYLSRVNTLPEILAGRLPGLAWGRTRKPKFERDLVFEGVSFSYPGASAPALENIDLVVRRGETLALVGESGSGKSTLARLALRLFDPSAGRVLADGLPVPELAREDWARLVGVVSQDAFLFDDTLEANVRYGSPDAAPERAREALRRARAEDFVAALPDKERTRLGERGVSLSGGQRQRVSIARAFLRDSSILILDEATSAMDSETERLVQEAIEDLSKERTMIVIAHRFSTIRRADRVVVLDKGRIAEQGTWNELLARGGLFKRYHDLQQSAGGAK